MSDQKDWSPQKVAEYSSHMAALEEYDKFPLNSLRSFAVSGIGFSTAIITLYTF